MIAAEKVDVPVREVSRWRVARVVLAALIVVVSLVAPAEWIESVYSDGFFPVLQRWLVPLFGFLPVPVMGCAILGVPVVLAWRVRSGWRRARSAGVGPWGCVGLGSLKALRLVLYLYAAFLLLWGLGYRRIPIEERWGIEDRPATFADVQEVQARLLALIHRDCVESMDRDLERSRRAIEDAQAELVESVEGFRPVWPRYIKTAPWGLLLRMNVAGVVSPWTLEVHVEGVLPGPHWLGVLGHELAHVAGYCGEADANLVGFVSGLRAKDAYARYGTALRLLSYTRSREGAKEYRAALRTLPQRARDDLAAMRRVREEYVQERVGAAFGAIYSRYLKSQGVVAGGADYARGFRLFVRAVRKGLVPLPKVR